MSSLRPLLNSAKTRALSRTHSANHYLASTSFDRCPNLGIRCHRGFSLSTDCRSPVTTFTEDEEMTREAVRSWARDELQPVVR